MKWIEDTNGLIDKMRKEECFNCGTWFKVTFKKCPRCGEKYDEDPQRAWNYLDNKKTPQ